MTIQTADVRDIACLFFSQVSELINNQSYGIECDEDALLEDINKTLKHYEFNCWYNDYIRETVDEATIPEVCDRYTFTQAEIG